MKTSNDKIKNDLNSIPRFNDDAFMFVTNSETDYSISVLYLCACCGNILRATNFENVGKLILIFVTIIIICWLSAAIKEKK